MPPAKKAQPGDDKKEKLLAWIERDVPDSPQVSLIHNDFKLDNLMVANDDPARAVAVLDWDMYGEWQRRACDHFGGPRDRVIVDSCGGGGYGPPAAADTRKDKDTADQRREIA